MEMAKDNVDNMEDLHAKAQKFINLEDTLDAQPIVDYQPHNPLREGKKPRVVEPQRAKSSKQPNYTTYIPLNASRSRILQEDTIVDLIQEGHHQEGAPCPGLTRDVIHVGNTPTDTVRTTGGKEVMLTFIPSLGASLPAVIVGDQPLCKRSKPSSWSLVASRLTTPFGRPTLNYLEIVVSTPHLRMNFLTKDFKVYMVQVINMLSGVATKSQTHQQVEVAQPRPTSSPLASRQQLFMFSCLLGMCNGTRLPKSLGKNHYKASKHIW
ncbi:hypothetical protein Lal_00026545 [Lupinus albus]|nr:hypothetical protein Lal_00026545 [Lupinus albus]